MSSQHAHITWYRAKNTTPVCSAVLSAELFLREKSGRPRRGGEGAPAWHASRSFCDGCSAYHLLPPVTCRRRSISFLVCHPSESPSQLGVAQFVLSGVAKQNCHQIGCARRLTGCSEKASINFRVQFICIQLFLTSKLSCRIQNFEAKIE